MAKRKEYVALRACRSDETGAAFAPGDVVTDKDFPAAVIENWLEIGVLIPEPAGGAGISAEEVERRRAELEAQGLTPANAFDDAVLETLEATLDEEE